MSHLVGMSSDIELVFLLMIKKTKHYMILILNEELLSVFFVIVVLTFGSSFVVHRDGAKRGLGGYASHHSMLSPPHWKVKNYFFGGVWHL